MPIFEAEEPGGKRQLRPSITVEARIVLPAPAGRDRRAFGNPALAPLDPEDWALHGPISDMALSLETTEATRDRVSVRTRLVDLDTWGERAVSGFLGVLGGQALNPTWRELWDCSVDLILINQRQSDTRTTCAKSKRAPQLGASGIW
ncbi:hypothetical protein FOPE_12608 [Fonsecaea pedrosoi]|nr:hypothetical protein FOPE_12608 [Fonsecaea pedrosoi]